MKEFRIAIFASGSGTNAEKIIEYFDNHDQIAVSIVLSNNATAGVHSRAARHGIKSITFTREEFTNRNSLLRTLNDHAVTHIVLAGFLWLIPDFLIASYPDRIINIHPALLPKYGGKGMYGNKVHQAVKAASETMTGITIHLVNEVYDEGRVLFQTSCEIDKSLSAEQIAACVHKLEHHHYPRVIEKWVTGKV
jgi:phosphoribosylglycinamide formyltransferase 1